MPYPAKLRLGLGLGLAYGGSPMGGGGVTPRTNNYLRFDGSSYGQFEQAITLSGDFEIKFDVLPALLDSFNMILGYSLASSMFVSVQADGSLRLRIGGNEYTTTPSAVTVGALSNVVIAFAQPTLTVKVDGSVVYSADVTFPPFVLDYVGRWSSDQFKFNGIISNLTITDNGTEVANVYIDNQGTDTQTNLADSNNNLILNGVNHTTDWYELDSASGYYLGYERVTIAQPFDTVPIGGASVTAYLVDATADSGFSFFVLASVSNYVGSGTVGYSNRAGIGTTARRASNGAIAEVFTATSTDIMALFNRDVNQCTFSDISVREVLNP